MRITVEGNVGIGTTQPSDGSASGGQPLKLDVQGAVGATHYCDASGNNCAQAPLGGDFGGMFSISGVGLIPIFGCTQPNPYTGDCSCQPGYNIEPLTGGIVSPVSGWVALSDHWIFYCWK